MTETAHRSILESFAAAPDQVIWLRALVDNVPLGDARVPRDADRLNHLIAMVVQANDRHLSERLGHAAGVLLRTFAISAIAGMAAQDDLARLGSVLKVFEAVPAEPETSRLLYALLQCELFGVDSVTMQDRRRKALIALAISPAPGLSVEEVLGMFRRELRDSRFALAAFGGMCRLSLVEAIKRLHEVLETFAGHEAARRLALMTLIRRIADRADLALCMRDVLEKHGLIDVAIRSMEANGVPESAPKVWDILTGNQIRSRPKSAKRRSPDHAPAQRIADSSPRAKAYQVTEPLMKAA
ncbi:MAG: hypothetical protein EPO26_07895 [Chloroflexota bacterium]|nr:MAG: hypothetical protein EPO26_07895 [Chloroflexota bacterium]